LAGDAPEGLCPECLSSVAFSDQSVIESAATAHFAAVAAATVTAAPGTRIKYFGDYELLEEIAHGGMGVVWKARQTSLNRIVALKMIRAGALATESEVRRFHREAEAAANLQHPNIVAIHEVGQHNGQHYFSMDYVEGRDLGALVEREPLLARRAARYVQIIAEAIHFAHQRGTLHRDLKPQNVLIDASDRPRITDFGLAKLTSDDSRLTQSGVVMGSPSYMPPEQAAGRVAEIGPQSDVYSIGAILFELLTGRAPFQGSTPLSTLREVMESEPTGPRRLNPDVPIDLETICLKCLEKSRTARYHSARELADDLGRFLAGEPIVARRASVIRKVVSWSRRHPGVLAAAGAVLVVGLLFGVLYLFEDNQFLRAMQANPSLRRQPGPLTPAVEAWSAVNSLVTAAAIWAAIFVSRRALKLDWKEMFNPAAQFRPRKPIGEKVRTFAAIVGVVALGSGSSTLVIVMKAYIWEGTSRFGDWLGVYSSVWFGLTLIALAVRDYRLAVFGAPVRQLDRPQIDEIQQYLMTMHIPGAIRSYRRFFPDASLEEAHSYVLSIAAKLHTESPNKMKPPALSLANLNWRAIAICAAIEISLAGAIIVIGGFPQQWQATAYYAATGFLWGLGVLASARLAGFWRRFVAQCPGLALLVVGPAIKLEFMLAPLFIGMIAGACIMISGYTRRRPDFRRP
jgi:tRNA A-37 threonylcarbamoyl transferase component Bud32